MRGVEATAATATGEAVEYSASARSVARHLCLMDTWTPTFLCIVCRGHQQHGCPLCGTHYKHAVVSVQIRIR